MLIALLDYDGLNPVSRIVKGKKDSVEEAVKQLRKEMRKQDEKGSIGQIKKKLGVGKKKKFAKKIDNFELVLEKEQKQV